MNSVASINFDITAIDSPDATANCPALWDRILRAVRQVYGQDALIAGGAVRDHLLGYEPKDIDIFVNIDSQDVLLERMKILEDFGFDLAQFEPDDDMTHYDELKDGRIRGIIEGAFYDSGHEWVVQIIAMPFTRASDLINQFDLGITRGWYDGVLHDPPEARADRENKTVTILTNVTLERSNHRAKRFIEKSDYSFRKVPYVPDTL